MSELLHISFGIILNWSPLSTVMIWIDLTRQSSFEWCMTQMNDGAMPQKPHFLMHQRMNGRGPSDLHLNNLRNLETSCRNACFLPENHCHFIFYTRCSKYSCGRQHIPEFSICNYVHVLSYYYHNKNLRVVLLYRPILPRIQPKATSPGTLSSMALQVEES